ncbi:hypothetical protein [Clostridium sp. LP20]|uniref:hypothetical protein n=1 Tax=Clostridium sp. LP20 TaxID=3418665 RepID=UPI003EE7BA26
MVKDENDLGCPIKVRDGRRWLDNMFRDKEVKIDYIEEKNERVNEVAKLLDLDKLLDMHPYDLSGW